MRIAWLMPNLHVSGGAITAIELAERMTRKGHELYLMLPSGRSRWKRAINANVIECGLQLTNPLTTIPFAIVAMALKLPKVDLIVASAPPYAILARSIAFVRGIQSVNYCLSDEVHIFDDRSYLHSVALLKLYHSIARYSIRRTNIITNSLWTATKIVAEKGEKPFAIVPSGYNPSIFYPNQENVLHNKENRLLTIGRHMRSKGLPDLIDALNLIDLTKYPFILRIVSQDQLDLSKARFNFEIYKPTVGEDISAHYRWAEIFINPSWFEGFGMPPLEAQACGCGVISTDCGGIKEFLRDEVNALIVPPREPRTMARAVIRLMEDLELMSRLIKEGLVTCQDFTWDKAADKFEAALNSILKKN
jgi:glycosyltransferase involved in cell wall biosynthesis